MKTTQLICKECMYKKGTFKGGCDCEVTSKFLIGSDGFFFGVVGKVEYSHE